MWPSTLEAYFGTYWLGRTLFQRSLAAIYLIAFIAALQQFPALLGENGLLPVPEFLRRLPLRAAPSLFQFGYSDALFFVVAWLGIALSLIALLGISERGPLWASMATWLLMWGLYLSIVNVGQVFYGFGWESMLLEAGFFAAFLGPRGIVPSLIPILILRWMLFRVEFGAGMIKLRGDECWRDLSCLFYHYETQPLPNPLSWYFHYIGNFFQKISVLFSHFVQLIVPFGLFGPQRIAAIAAGLMIFHQFWLIISGNYSWLNWLTVILGLSALSDLVLSSNKILSLSEISARPHLFNYTLYAVGAIVLALSIQPALNLVSKRQLMNYNYNPLHLVGSYGAFGSITKKRYEIILEGTQDAVLSPRTKWQAYEFRAKPGDLRRRPVQIAPYHLRLDWLMWFLPFSVQVDSDGINVAGYQKWFLRFVKKLLQADAQTLALLRSSPFGKEKPRFIRARYFLYHYTNADERKKTGAWWKRDLIGNYLPAVSLADVEKF